MKLTRRNFLAWAGLSAIGAVACDAFGDELKTQSPVSQPEDLVKGRDNWYATLCRHCPSSEGVLVRVMEGRAKKVQGNPKYPINLGKQSARCDAGLQALYHPDRLAGPMLRINGTLQPVSWDVALDQLKEQLSTRGEGLALVTEPLSGPLATIASRFAQAFGGSHITFEALSNATYQAAVKNLFDQELLPDLDIGKANFLLSFGADFLSTWVSPTRWSIGFGELRDAEVGSGRGTFVQIDPRFSMTAANADKWLPIRPGMEGHLALSLAQVIVQEKLQADGVDLAALSGGQGAEFLSDFSPEAVGPKLGWPDAMLGGHNAADTIRELARDFASHRPSLAIGGDSAGAQENGLFNLEAIYALNYLVGSVGGPGGLRFNPKSPLPEWPQPSAAASISDWRDTISALNQGKTKLLMVHQADPVYGLPQALGLEDAIKRADVFTVSFSPFLDETSALADLILPDRIYLEDWGADIPNPGPGYQVVGIQQPVVNPLGSLDPRSFGDILLSTAQELREDAALPWDNLLEALEESSKALFALNRGSVDAGSEKEFWTKLLRQGGWWDEQTTGPAVQPAEGLFSRIAKQAPEPAALGSGEFYLIPFAHNTLLDGRNTHLPWAQSAPDPITTVTWQTWVEVNARRASDLGWREGDVIRIEVNGSFIQALLYPNPALPPDVVAVPLGQGRRNGPAYALTGEERESSNILGILDPALVNETGALAWAGNRVRLAATGESLRVSKFEGEFGAREIGNQIINNPGEEVIKTVAPGGH